MLGGSWFSVRSPADTVQCGGPGTAVVIGPYALVLPSGDGRMAFDCSVLFFLAGQ